MDPLFWLFVWVVGMALIGAANHGGLGVIMGAFAGLCLWALIGFVVFLWTAMSVNDCREYGHPDLADTSNGKTCSDDDLRYFVEHH